MIYGANGYTGSLIAREAQSRGFQPILGGRNSMEVELLAKELNLEFRVFDLSSLDVITNNVADLNLVLNCAGPFTKTVQALLTACISNHCHYLDISGELAVFEYCQGESQKAKDAGCIVCPGVAFDIVPTEIAAAKLKQLLPAAEALKIGFDGKMALSKGSSITLLEGIGNPELSVYMIRKDGVVQRLTKPHIEKAVFAVGEKPRKAMAITWADLNGAFYSTGIPNIAVFVPATLVNRLSFAVMERLKPVFSFGKVQSILAGLIKSFVKGPSKNDLDEGGMTVFGEATAPSGEMVRISFTVAHGYRFTCLSALAIVEHCLNCKNTGGYFTPSMLMGTDFVEQLEGSSRYKIERLSGSHKMQYVKLG